MLWVQEGFMVEVQSVRFCSDPVQATSPRKMDPVPNPNCPLPVKAKAPIWKINNSYNGDCIV